MILANLHHKLHHGVWYILPSYFQTLKLAIEEQEKQFPAMRQSDVESLLAFFCPQRPPMQIDSNGIALINIQGVLGNALAPIEKMLGMCGYEDVASEVDAAMDGGAKAILFNLASPGGEANGAQETAAKIAAIDIPKASFSGDLDASACYFLSASCDYKVASPSAQTGCIGTIMPVIDASKLWDALGLEWKPITGESEELKGAGLGPSLTDTQRQYFQTQVNQRSATFRDFVSTYRDLDYGRLRAGTYFGAQALELNLIDKIGSYEEAYNWLLTQI